MLPKIEIQDIPRLSNIQRWGVVRTARQSVAEHSFNVAHIVMEIFDRAERVDLAGDSSSRRMAVEYALCHDLDEIHTGDIPAPFKMEIDSLLFDSPTMKEKSPLGFEKHTAFEIVKIADLMEAHCFISTNMGTADPNHAIRAQTKLVKKIDRMKLNFNEGLQRIVTETLYDMNFKKGNYHGV